MWSLFKKSPLKEFSKRYPNMECYEDEGNCPFCKKETPMLIGSAKYIGDFIQIRRLCLSCKSKSINDEWTKEGEE